MREIILIGINHKTAPVELRECIAFSKDEAVTATEALRGRPHIHESLLYSTCNRVELLLVTDDTAAAVADAKAFMPISTKSPSRSSKAPCTSTPTTRPCATCSGWPQAWTR